MLHEKIEKVTGAKGDLISVPISPFSKRISGIYFLIRQGVVVYVGQSASARLWIAQHADESVHGTGDWGHSEPKLFDSASYIPCAISDLCRLERAFIIELRPEYNATYGCWNPALSPRGSVGHQKTIGLQRLTSAEEHYQEIEQARDLAFSFLTNTDEDEISVRDMRQRLIDNGGPRVGLLRVIFMLEKDSRLKFDSNSQSFRLATIPARV